MSRTATTHMGRPPPATDARLRLVFCPDGRILVRLPQNEARVRAVAQRLWERGWRLSEAEPEDGGYHVLWFVRRERPTEKT